MKKTQNAIIVYHEDSTDGSENESNQKKETKDDGRATTNAILNLNVNPFYNDKRKWDDTFTVAEKKALQGNIVKAAKDNDGETYVTLQEEVVSTKPPQSQTEEESQESDECDENTNKKPGRKPMADEDSLSDPDQDPKVKRKAQNRAAQRAFRERKEKYVKELEIKIKQIQDTHMVSISQLLGENQQLRAIVYRLEMENANLKGIPFQPYRSELNAVPHHSPLIQPTHQRIGNYPQIAPLLSHPTILPSSPALSVSSTLSNHPVPISPYHPTTPPQATKKSTTKKPIKQTVNQPLEYTFSISTPASLRPSHSDTSNTKQNQASEPVKLVQLYPPSGKRSSKPEEPEEKPTDTSSVVSTDSTTKRMDQLELDLIDCHIDPEGRSFCEKLHDQVYHDAFNQLLSEPLFDQMGKLNLVFDKDERKHKDERVFNCQEIWFMLSQQQHELTTDELFQKVKKVAKWSDVGPVLEQSDLTRILTEIKKEEKK